MNSVAMLLHMTDKVCLVRLFAVLLLYLYNVEASCKLILYSQIVRKSY